MSTQEIGKVYMANGWPKVCTHLFLSERGVTPHFGMGNWYDDDRVSATETTQEELDRFAEQVSSVNSFGNVATMIESYAARDTQGNLWIATGFIRGALRRAGLSFTCPDCGQDQTVATCDSDMLFDCPNCHCFFDPLHTLRIEHGLPTLLDEPVSAGDFLRHVVA